MKLINYKYGYNNTFNCSIHGKIVISAEEWEKVLKYLTSEAVKKSFLPSYPWTNSMLLEDIQRRINVKDGYLINIRVPMTEKIAEKYSLKNYKRGNYMIFVEVPTAYEYELRGNYGHGWEVLTTESTRTEIKQRLKEYQENEGGRYKIVKIKA